MATLQDYRDREHWSYSAINQFLNICSLQFAFQRLHRLAPAFTPVSLSFGSAFHRCAEWLSLLRKEGKQPAKQEAVEVFQAAWERQAQEDGNIRFDEGEDAAAVANQGREMIGCMVESLDPEEEVLSVNEAFAVPLVDAQGQVLEKPLVGEIDCRVVKAGTEALVDWKTSGRRWPKDQAEKSLQPTAYLYAYRQLHGKNIPMRFDVVVKNKTPVMEQHTTVRSSEQFNRLVMLVGRIEKMIAGEHFLPNEQGFYCSGCPYQGPCKAWHREAERVSVRMAA